MAPVTSLLLALTLSFCWDPVPVNYWQTFIYENGGWRMSIVRVPKMRENCAEPICIYKHPRAVSYGGVVSPWPMLLWPPPTGGCDE
jgi:hypothetical protein